MKRIGELDRMKKDELLTYILKERKLLNDQIQVWYDEAQYLKRKLEGMK